MGGRVRVRRLLTRTLPAAALVLVVAMLPSFGSTSVPTAVLAGSTSATAVVHLLGDEVAPASLVPSTDRSRPSAFGHAGLGVVLLVALAAATLPVVGPSSGTAGRVPHRLVTRRGGGRAPPRSFAHP